MGIERQYHDKATDATYVSLHGQVILGHDIVVNTGEYYGLVGPGESHLMRTTDQ